MKTVLAIVLLAFAATASADLPYGGFQAMLKDNQESTNVFLMGLGDGINVINAQLVADGDRPFFCPPRGTRFDPDDYKDILGRYERQVARKSLEEYPVSMMLLHALMVQFPCR